MRCSSTRRTANGCGPSRAIRCVSSSGIRGQHQRQMAAPPQTRRSTVSDAGGDVQIHRSHARRHRAPVHLRDGSQVSHHFSVRRPTSARERILRNLWPGVVRPRADHARRRFHRRWRKLERSSPSATRSGQMPDALSPVLELGWRSSAIAEPHRRQDRVRTADACAARRHTRASFQLPLQRHSNMAGRARRSGDQCLIACERS